MMERLDEPVKIRIRKNQLISHHNAKMRKTLFTERGPFCEECLEDFNCSCLYIDHEFPSALGGTNEKDNLKLKCRECHLKKTRFDVFVVNTLKKMNLLDTSYKIEFDLYLLNEDVKRFYNLMKKLYLSDEDFAENFYDLKTQPKTAKNFIPKNH